MNTGSIKDCTKWAWSAAVIIFIVYYGISKKDLIYQAVAMLPIKNLLSSGLMVFSAKLCLVSNMRQAAHSFDVKISFFEGYRIYNLTQLAKYIPGSIWQFLGRIAFLQNRGVPLSDIRDSLFAEHLWMLSSAGIMGFIMVYFAKPEFFFLWLSKFGVDLKISHLWFLAIIVSILTCLVFFKKNMISWVISLRPPLRALPALFFTWVLLGTSLWVILHPFTVPPLPLSFIIGIYCLAYVVGFLVPFAPAGLGIREAILVTGMVPFVSLEQAIVLAAVSRVIYFAVEILAAVICLQKKDLFRA